MLRLITISCLLIGFTLHSAGAQDAPKPRVDRLGDLLPEGALARLGTLRLRQGGIVWTMAMSPDGKMVASGGLDEAIRVWDTASGKELRQLKIPNPFQDPRFGIQQIQVTALAFGNDGKTLVSGDSLGILRLWDVEKAAEVRRFGNTLRRERIISMSISHDGRLLWTCGYDRIIRQWLLATGMEIRQFQGHQGNVFGLIASPDGKRLTSVDSTGSVRVWDVTKGQEVRQFNLQRNLQFENGLAFSRDVKLLAISDFDSVSLFDVGEGRFLRQIRGPVGARPTGMAFAPNGKTLALASLNGGVRVFGVTSGQELRHFDTPPSTNARAVLHFSADGKTLACSCGDQSIRLWDLASSRDVMSASSHTGPVQSVCYSQGGMLVASASPIDRTVRIWEAATGRPLARINYSTTSYNLNVVPGPDNGFLVSTQEGLTHWQLKEKKIVQGRKYEQARMPAFVTASPDGSSVAVISSADQKVSVIDTRSGDLKVRIGDGANVAPKQPPFNPVLRFTTAAFSPDGTLLACAGYSIPVQIWNVRTGKLLRQLRPDPIRGMPSGQVKLAFSPDGKTLAVGEHDIRLYEVATGMDRLYMPNINPAAGIGVPSGGHIRALAFSPDGSLLLAGTFKGGIALYDVMTGFEAGQLTGHLAEVKALALAPNGKGIASAGADAAVLIWDALALAKKGRPVATLLNDEIDLLWKLLGEADSGRAYQALGSLVAAAPQTVPYIKQRLKAAEAVDLKRIGQLIVDLDDPQFNVRQKATRELEKFGDLAEPDLVKALDQKPPLEVRKRIEQILSKLQGPSNEKLHFMRALEALERTGVPEAREIFATLARGFEGHWMTENARQALERMKRAE